MRRESGPDKSCIEVLGDEFLKSLLFSRRQTITGSWIPSLKLIQRL